MGLKLSQNHRAQKASPRGLILFTDPGCSPYLRTGQAVGMGMAWPGNHCPASSFTLALGPLRA